MKKIETAIKGLYLIESDCFGDNRGWFMETFNEVKFQEMGIDARFVQDNLSYSAQKGTLRGMHYQRAPHSQAKLVRCIRGAIVDVIVDSITIFIVVICDYNKNKTYYQNYD